MRRRKGFRGGVHFASCRRLGVESLETRRLLAGDSLSLSQHPIDDSPAIESVSQQIQDLAVNFSASDAAGDTMRTAADLGVIDGTLQRSGRLSWFDRIDVVRFEIAADAKVRITLDQLNRDANLYVLDRNGHLIGSSTRSSNRSESLSGSLPDGEYYLAISSVDYRSISYRLTLDVQTARSQPTVNPPAAPTPEPEQPPPPEPTTVTPLAEVAYFGGSREWNLNAVAAPEAWAAGYRGQGVTVAVIDTGVDLDHPDLAGALYVNPGEIAGNGIDDDRNGFVDDVSGYDFVSGDAIADDGNGHGTHVAGTIAASDNGFGVTGVAPDAKILPVRVLDDSGSGTDAGVAAGIRYAADLGVQIINLSLGGGISSRIASAIDYATSSGALVVAAAGNESAASPSYPARHSAESTSVLSVGAFDSSGRIAGFSNNVGGSGAVQVDAPGVSVYSTYAGGGYRSLSGTSMASPHVAAVAALTLSANPQLTSSQLRELLSSGTVGQATSSDSIGKVSTLNSVAFAAAGLTSTGGITGSQIATSATSSTDVRTKSGDGVPVPSDRLPQRPAGTVAAAGRLEGDVEPLPVEMPGIKQVANAESLSSQAVDNALADVDVDWTEAVQRQHDADPFIELPGDLDAAGSGISLRGSAS